MRKRKTTPKPTQPQKDVPDLSYGDAVNLKTELTSEIKSSVKDDIRKWILHWGWVPVALVLAVLTFFGWWSYQGLKELQQHILERATKDFDRTVRERFSEANVGATVDALIQEQATDLIKSSVEEYAVPRIQAEVASFRTESIVPLTSALAGLTTQTSNMAQRVTGLKESLDLAEARYENLSGDIGLLRLHAASTVGSRDAFVSLLSASTNSSKPTATFADTLLSDLNRRYKEFKNERTYQNMSTLRNMVVHSVTGKEYKSPAEIFRNTFDTDRSFQKQAEIDNIAKRKLHYFVEDLVSVVHADPDLFVASRAVSALEKLTGEKFADSPPFGDVGEWWELSGHTNTLYSSPFPLIDKGDKALQRGEIDTAITLFSEAVTNRHGLARTHYKLAQLHFLKGDEEQATNQLAYAVSEAEGQVDAILLQAAVVLKHGDTNQVVTLIKSAMPFIENAEQFITRDRRFNDLRQNAEFLKLIEKSEEKPQPEN